MNSNNRDSEFEELRDLEQRRGSHRRWFNKRQPKPIGNVIAQLVQRKGYAQVRVASERDEAWRTAIGQQLAPMTRVGAMRRGVLEILVANSLVMQELTFRKPDLISLLAKALPKHKISDLRFRVGKIS